MISVKRWSVHSFLIILYIIVIALAKFSQKFMINISCQNDKENPEKPYATRMQIIVLNELFWHVLTECTTLYIVIST